MIRKVRYCSCKPGNKNHVVTEAELIINEDGTYSIGYTTTIGPIKHG